MRYVTVDELVYINQQVMTGEAIHSIVEGKRAVRDMGLLEAAVVRPMASAFGEDAYPTLGEKVAVMLHAVARNHPFADGNKRAATVAALFMLAVNGQRVTWDAHEALTWIVDVAEGKTQCRVVRGVVTDAGKRIRTRTGCGTRYAFDRPIDGRASVVADGIGGR